MTEKNTKSYQESLTFALKLFNNHEWYVPFIMHMDRVMVGEKTHYGYKEIKTERGLVTDEIVYFNASVWENPLLEIV